MTMVPSGWQAPGDWIEHGAALKTSGRGSAAATEQVSWCSSQQSPDGALISSGETSRLQAG